MDKITILGTAGDAIVMGKQARASGGIALELAGNQLHLDPGPGTLVQLKTAGLSARESVGIVVTSSATLRANDMEAVISAMTLDGQDKHGVLLAPQHLLEGQIVRLSPRSRGFLEGVVALQPGNKAGLNEITITPVRIESEWEESLGLRIESHSFAIGYTGDGVLDDAAIEAFAGVQVLLLNVIDVEGAAHGRMSLAQAKELIARIRPRQAILSSLGTKMLEQDPAQAAAHIARETGAPTIAATDGQVIEIAQR